HNDHVVADEAQHAVGVADYVARLRWNEDALDLEHGGKLPLQVAPAPRRVLAKNLVRQDRLAGAGNDVAAVEVDVVGAQRGAGRNGSPNLVRGNPPLVPAEVIGFVA